MTNTQGGSPLSHIESKEGVQDGKYCLRGTRIPLDAIVESLKDTTLKEIVKSFKLFEHKISEEELRWAVMEYKREILREYD